MGACLSFFSIFGLNNGLKAPVWRDWKIFLKDGFLWLPRGAQWLPDELGTPALAESIDKTLFDPDEVKIGQDVPVPKFKLILGHHATIKGLLSLSWSPCKVC